MALQGTFTSNSDGMQYHIANPVANSNYRLTVTDVHTNDIQADINPSINTPAGSGSFQLKKNSRDATSLTFQVQTEGTTFVLTKGTQYRAFIQKDNVPIPALSKVETYMPIPPNGFYVANVQHGNSSIVVRAGPAIVTADPAADNAYAVTNYVVTIYPSATSVAKEPSVVTFFTWQKTYTYDELASNLTISTSTQDDSLTSMGANLNNLTSYEVIVAAENASGCVDTAPSFHVTPRATPNDIAVFNATGGIDMTNNADMDDKIEFSLTGGVQAGTDDFPNDTGVIVKLTGPGITDPLYKWFEHGDGTGANNAENNVPIQITDEVISSSSLLWKTQLSNVNSNNVPTTTTRPYGEDVSPSIVNGNTYTLSAYALNTVGAGILPGTTVTATSSGLPFVPIVELSAGYGDHQVKVSIGGPETNEYPLDVDNGSAITKYTVEASNITGGAPVEYSVPLIDDDNNVAFPRYFYVSPPLAARAYTPSTNVTVGVAVGADGIDGYKWSASSFQINLLRNVALTAYSTSNPPIGSVEYWNGDRGEGEGQMPDGNFTAGNNYILLINVAGGMDVSTYDGTSQTTTTTSDADTQWTITSTGMTGRQTILRGTVDTTTVSGTTRLVVKDREYRKFASVAADALGDAELQMYTEVEAYSFIGEPASLTQDTVLTVEINRTPIAVGVQLGLPGVILQDGTSYDLTIKAHNYNGSTADSMNVAQSTVVPRTTPNAPIFASCAPHINAISTLGSGKVQGSITALAHPSQTGGDALITYVYSLVDQTILEPETIADISGVGLTTATFEGLTDGRSYKMSVRAVNSFHDTATSYDASDDAGPVTICGPTLVPSVAPSVTSEMSKALTDLIVNKSHKILEINNPINVDGFDMASGGYPITGVKVTATPTIGDSFTQNIEVGSTSLTTLITAGHAPTGITQDHHEFTLSFMPYNAVYGSDMDNTPTSTADAVGDVLTSHVHYTSADLIPTVVPPVIGDHSLTYAVSLPNWETNWSVLKGASLTYNVFSSAPTSGQGVDGSIGYNTQEYVSGQVVDNAINDVLVAGTATSIVIDNLNNGTKYKFVVNSTAKDYHNDNDLYNSNTAEYSDPNQPDANGLGYADMPYGKPLINWTGSLLTRAAQISSNGRPLGNSIMINSLTRNDLNAVVSYDSLLTASTAGSAANKYIGGNPPFTQYMTSVGGSAQLYSTATVTASHSSSNFIFITENLAGASVDIAGTHSVFNVEAP